MIYKLIVFLFQLKFGFGQNLTIEDFFIYEVGWIAEFIESTGCDEIKAGFEIHFYLLPMIY